MKMTSNEQDKKPENNVALAIIKMPDGKEHEIPLPPKTYSSGREGYYAQIQSFVYDNEVYGSQIQIRKKDNK